MMSLPCVHLKGLHLAFWACAAAMAVAQPTIRADKSYEDTVRILILSNDSAKGYCGPQANNVGIRTRDFLLKSLSGIPNVVYRESQSTTWDMVKAIWPGRLPHVVVHVNAGWSTMSGNYINQIMNSSADSGIGVVSVGDDAASFAEKTFGFKNVSNFPQPMGDARQYNSPQSSLWLDLDGKADTVGGGGIVRLTTDSLKVNRLFFNPVEPNSGSDPALRYRCEADADQYLVDSAYRDKVTFLGFQRAFDGRDTVGGPRALQTIVAFQDDVRRGVALSYQPQFLANEQAAHQINYDAIIYASFAHFLREPSLRFTDENGRGLTSLDAWSPAKGKLYLTFTDDFVRADLTKEIRFTVVNASGTAAGDVEAVMVGTPVSISGGRGSWRAEIALVEKTAAASNGMVEVSLPSVINATVSSHDENGLSDGGTATAQLTLKLVVPPPPPPIPDTLLASWMKDANGNGAADLATLVFTRPLTALPSAMGPIYWNDFAPPFANARTPRLSFLPGSGQTVVLADFAGAEFPVGLTSVPPGGRPQAVFPGGNVVAGPNSNLADSVGPIPLSAEIALGAAGNALGREPDTLRVNISEPLRPGVTSLIRFGKFKDNACLDRAGSAAAMALGGATITPDGLRYTMILDAKSPNPVSGDCAYLEGNGSVLDLPGNVPAGLGVRITGPKVPQGVRAASGFPAVSGGGANNPTLAPEPMQWIAPVGYVPGITFVETQLPAPGQTAAGQDPNKLQPLPEGDVLVEVLSAGKYVAKVALFDHLGVFVKDFSQSFGYKGELDNAARLSAQGYRSYLVWDGRDAKGQRAGQGAYIWKIEFTLDDGETQTKKLRTGLLR